jgi:putative signal transducing protein
MENNSNTLVTILTASLIHEIHIAKTLLASQGIHSFIIDENIATSIGTAFVEGYKLKVSTLDFEKATQLLNDVDADNN